MFDITMRSGVSIEKTYSIPMKSNPDNIQELIVIIDPTPSMSWLMSITLVFQSQHQAEQFKQNRLDKRWIVRDKNLEFEFLFNAASKKPYHQFNLPQRQTLGAIYFSADWEKCRRIKVQLTRRTLELATFPLLNQAENDSSLESHIVVNNIKDALLDYMDMGKRANIQVWTKYTIPLKSSDSPIKNLVVVIEPSRAISHLISVALVFKSQDEAKKFQQDKKFANWTIKDKALQFAFLFKDNKPLYDFSGDQVKTLEEIYLSADWSQCCQMSVDSSRRTASIQMNPISESRIIANYVRDTLLDYMHKLQIRMEIGTFGFNFLTLTTYNKNTLQGNIKNLVSDSFRLNETKDIVEYKSRRITDITQAKDFLQSLKAEGYISGILFNHYINELNVVQSQSKIYTVFPSRDTKFTIYIITRSLAEFNELQKSLKGLYDRNMDCHASRHYFGKIFENRITISGKSQEELASKIVKAVDILKENHFLAEDHVQAFYQLAELELTNSLKRKRSNEAETEVPAQSFMPGLPTNDNNNTTSSSSIVVSSNRTYIKDSKTEMDVPPRQLSSAVVPSTHAQLLNSSSGMKRLRTTANIPTGQLVPNTHTPLSRPPALKKSNTSVRAEPPLSTVVPTLPIHGQFSRYPGLHVQNNHNSRQLNSSPAVLTHNKFNTPVKQNRSLALTKMNVSAIVPPITSNLVQSNSVAIPPLSTLVTPEKSNTNADKEKGWRPTGALLEFLPDLSDKNDNDSDPSMTC